MKIRSMTDVGPPLTQKDIEKLEKKLGARLPASYKKFLLLYNGGTPEPACFGISVMAEFFGISRDEMYDLMANRRQIKEWIPEEITPIADDVFGNAICIAVKGKNRGKVYFWDHEGGTERVDVRAMFPEIQFKPYDEGEPRPPIKDDWPGHPDLKLIADSFTEFLESFHEEPEDDEEPEDEPPEPEDDDEPEDEPPGPPLEPAVWLLPGKPRKATRATASKTKGGSKASKVKGGSKAAKARPPAKKGTKARSRDKG